MTRIIIVFFALVAVGSCRQRMGTASARPATDPVALARREDSNRKYFVDSFAYKNEFGLDADSAFRFTTFLKARYPGLPITNSNRGFDPVLDEFRYAFKEEFIDTVHIDTTRQWLRILVMPSFGIPYCLVLENRAGRSLFTFKITDGIGGYYTGDLLLTKQTNLPDTFAPRVFRELDSLGFWRLGEDTTDNGLDGTEWCVEAIDKGRYHQVMRWEPENEGNATTRRLGRIGGSLVQQGHFYDYLSLASKEFSPISPPYPPASPTDRILPP
jgi:hypothetical protein